MRRSPLSRIFAALLGIWFTYSFVTPPADMSGMVMGNGASMSLMSPNSASANMTSMDMSSMNPLAKAAASDGSAQSANQNATNATNDNSKPQKSSAPDCDHRDCCCSAISPSLLTPQSVLAWLPQHVIEQSLPKVGTNVLYSEGQVLLPFSNGPPNTVIA